MKRIIKKIIPSVVISWYHLVLAWVAAIRYGHPSERMIVVGVTGTSGKSSVVYFLRQILEAAGYKVGALSTVEFCVAGACTLNDRKMTMLGRTSTQKFLSDMVATWCEVAIVETTSEGYLQGRHRFINYDIIVLTNLYPEHLEAHGGFENYKAAKLGIFRYVANEKMGKVAIVNGESEYANEFLAFPFDKKIKFTAADALPTSVLGEHTSMNVAAALTVARALGVDESVLRRAAKQLRGVPGRIELIPEAEKYGFRVIVDYAFEPVAMGALYQVVEKLAPKRIIHVFGACGGGRDVAKRPVTGQFVAQRADVIILTNEDPYDDDPLRIIDDVAKGAEEIYGGKASGIAGGLASRYVLQILDRREAIGKALSLAQPGDLVLITGKGSEQAMCVAHGKKIPWDDRRVVREELSRLGLKT